MPQPIQPTIVQDWFEKGYGSKEMAMFLLLGDMAATPGFYRSFVDRVEESFKYYHDEVVKIIYKK